MDGSYSTFMRTFSSRTAILILWSSRNNDQRPSTCFCRHVHSCMLSIYLLHRSVINYSRDSKVDVFDKTQHETAVRRFHRQVENLERSRKRPTIQLDVTTVDLGKLACVVLTIPSRQDWLTTPHHRYKRSVSRTFNIRNTGKVCTY